MSRTPGVVGISVGVAVVPDGDLLWELYEQSAESLPPVFPEEWLAPNPCRREYP